MLQRSPLLCVHILLLLATALPAAAQSVSNLYRDHCASCHGNDLAGGGADSLLNDHWLTDGSDRALFEATKHGMEDLGMPGYAEGMTDEQIWGLIVYIRERAYNHRRETEGNAEAIDGVYRSQHHGFALEYVLQDVEGVNRPWAIEFLPDGRMIFTERAGTLYLCDTGTDNPRPVQGTPEVWQHGQGGLMDVALHPDFETTGWVYLAYSARSDDRGMTAIARGRIVDHQWTDHEVLFRSDPELDSPRGQHWGCRIAFDEAGYMFFAIGDRGLGRQAQELHRPNGKTHRLHDDGRVPDDNPFVGQADAMPSLYSFGHRNPQGLSFHPSTGELYTVEHGPRGGDELNHVLAGHNYGWPRVAYSINYNGTPFRTPWHEEAGFTEPVHYWLPSIAICGSSFYTGEAFADWQNDFFVASLAKNELHRVRLVDGQVIEDETLLRGLGRMRDVTTGADGLLYVVLENPGRIVRLVPAESP